MIKDQYKVRFNYLRLYTHIEDKHDWELVNALSPIEAILLVLNKNRISLGQILNIEVSHI